MPIDLVYVDSSAPTNDDNGLNTYTDNGEDLGGSTFFMCIIGWQTGAQRPTGMTWAGVAMTLVEDSFGINSSDGSGTACYTLNNPASGNNNVVVTGSGDLGVVNIAYIGTTGQDTSAIRTLVRNVSTAKVNTLSVTLPGVSDDSLMIVVQSSFSTGSGGFTANWSLFREDNGSPTAEMHTFGNSNQTGDQEFTYGTTNAEAISLVGVEIQQLKPATQTINVPPITFDLSMRPPSLTKVHGKLIQVPPLTMDLSFGQSFVIPVEQTIIQAPELKVQLSLGRVFLLHGTALRPPYVLQPGQSMTISVGFSPPADGTTQGNLVITSNAPTATIAVSGVGNTPIAPGVNSWLSTKGGTFIDATSGETVLLKSGAWYGMESWLFPHFLGPTGNPGQLPRPYKTITYTGPTELGLVNGTVYEGVLDEVKRLGFNSIRLPQCEDITWVNAQVMGALGTPLDGIDGPDVCGFLNPDLIDDQKPADYANDNFIPAIEILDKFIDYAGSIGLRIIIDIHSCAPEDGDNPAAETNGLWYTTDTPGAAGTGPTSGTIGSVGDPRNEQQWLDSLTFFANRYKDDTFIQHYHAMSGLDLINEPYASTWDDDPNTGIPAAYERAAALIHAINPNLMIFCEGTFGGLQWQGQTEFTGYSGNFTGVATRPVVLTVPNKLAYSPHEYSDLSQPRFQSDSFPATLAPWWDFVWGYIMKAEGQPYQAPIWIGEFGGDFRDLSTLTGAALTQATADRQWGATLASYLVSAGMSWDYWALVGGSYPTNVSNIIMGVFEFDQVTADPDVMRILAPLLASEPPDDGGGTVPVPTLKPLTAQGSKLFDSDGVQFVPHAINWYGFEQLLVPDGLESRPYKSIAGGTGVNEGILDQIKREGFNCIRLLFCQDITWTTAGPPTTEVPWTTTNGRRPVTENGHWNTAYIDPGFNLDFFTVADDGSGSIFNSPQPFVSSLEMLDKIVNYAGSIGLRIFGDMHCLAPNDSDINGNTRLPGPPSPEVSQGGDLTDAATTKLWYTTAAPGDAGSTAGVRYEYRSEAQAIAAHVALAKRYAGNAAWMGQDLINEPAAGTWDRNATTGLVGYYERCGKAIHAVNPDVLIICEGMAGNVDYGNTAAGEDQLYGVVWSGNLSGVATTPVTLNIPNKVVYSPHEYGSYGGEAAGFSPPSFGAVAKGFAHQWFYDPTYPANMPNIFSKEWGYLAEQDIAPVLIGEMGAELLVPPTSGSAGYNANNLAADQAWLTALSTYTKANSIGTALWALNPGGTPRGYLYKTTDGTTVDTENPNNNGVWSTEPNAEQKPYYSLFQS